VEEGSENEAYGYDAGDLNRKSGWERSKRENPKAKKRNTNNSGALLYDQLDDEDDEAMRSEKHSSSSSCAARLSNPKSSRKKWLFLKIEQKH